MALLALESHVEDPEFDQVAAEKFYNFLGYVALVVTFILVTIAIIHG